MGTSSYGLFIRTILSTHDYAEGQITDDIRCVGLPCVIKGLRFTRDIQYNNNIKKTCAVYYLYVPLLKL